MERSDYTAGLRAIADFYDAHPEIHLPVSSDTKREVFTNYFCSAAEDIALVARALKPCQKIWPSENKPGSEVFLEREMAPGMFLRFRTLRSTVCRLVTRTIPARVVEMPEETVEVWECDPILERDEDLEDTAAAVTALVVMAGDEIGNGSPEGIPAVPPSA